MFQEPEVSPQLIQLGAAVVITYLVMQIVKGVLEFAGKAPKLGMSNFPPVKVEIESDASTVYRLNRLDLEMAERVTRTEYESRHRDIKDQLVRIESKLDKSLQR
jgi:hypothetical protein